MKKWSVGLLLTFLSLGCFAQVQRNITPKTDSAKTTMTDETLSGEKGTTGKENKMEMIRSLNLSKDQRQQLKEMRQANKAKKALIESSNQLTEGQKKEQLRKLQRDAAGSLKNILSEEQSAKIREKLEAKKHQLQQ